MCEFELNPHPALVRDANNAASPYQGEACEFAEQMNGEGKEACKYAKRMNGEG